MIGVLGAGQLGRMLALAAFPLGERCIFLDPSPDAGAGHMSELLVGDYDDRELLAQLAERADVITYEFENVPADAARFLAERKPVYPPPAALDTAQDRFVENELLSRMGYEVAPFETADSVDEALAAAESIGLPVILKRRRGGYDGKGQHFAKTLEEVEEGWTALNAPIVVEGFVKFQRELSIIGARGRDGETVFYPLTENEHREGILRTSISPAEGSEQLQGEAERAARAVMEELSYVGVLAIELFDADGRLYANEMAPRVHNSGHWTIEGAETSQFENHLRAVLGLPLGSTAPRGHAAMVNFIGALPDGHAVSKIPGAHLHLYGKEPRPGRKVGHATVRADDRHQLLAALSNLRSVAEEQLS